MKVLVTGGTGFVGSWLVERLLEVGKLVGVNGQETTIEQIIVFDVMMPPGLFPDDPRLLLVTGDIANAETIKQLIDHDVQSVFHFAGIVSGQAETDLELGMRINIDGTRAVLNACRALKIYPRLVFASSIAVYGDNLPEIVTDETPLTPKTSYGMEKTCCEYMINDYARRGDVDGRSVRLSTIAIRPGKPNKGVGQWASSILREPLSGVEAICPVSKETVTVMMSIRRLVDAIIQVHNLPGENFGYNRGLLLPALSVSVSDMLKGLAQAAGNEAVQLVRFDPNEMIQQITDSWPKKIYSKRSEQWGICADVDISEIIQDYVKYAFDKKILLRKN